MELVIIILLIIYSAYKDFINSKERQELQLMLMSKDATEFVDLKKDGAEDTPKEEDPYIDVSDATVEQIVGAKDKI